ncbi:MAG: hypothetical protein ACR2P8_05535 [Myxococcota bacterium]
MLRTAFALTILAVGLAACTDPNPIIGAWVIDSDASSTGAEAAAALAGLRELEFREDKLVMKDESVDVAYEVDGQRVIVTRTAEGRGDIYTLTGEDRLQTELPMGIKVVYRRVTDTPPVAAEGQAQGAKQE